MSKNVVTEHWFLINLLYFYSSTSVFLVIIENRDLVVGDYYEMLVSMFTTACLYPAVVRADLDAGQQLQEYSG